MKSRLTFLLFFVALFNLSAQELSEKVIRKIEANVEKLTQVMSLDETQKSKVFELQKKLEIEKAKISKEFAKDSEEFKSATTKILKEYKAGLIEICTKEKYQLWSEYNRNNRPAPAAK